MAKNERKNRKQTTLEVWRGKTAQQEAETVPMAINYSQKLNADCALKQIFGHEAYKSDVQMRAVSTILTGLKFRLCGFLACMDSEKVAAVE